MQGKNEELPFKGFAVWMYCLLISGGSFQFGYALGLYSPVSKILMTIYHDEGYDWSIYNQEPHNTLVNTVTYIGAFTGIMTASFFAGKKRIIGIYAFNLFCIVGSILCCIVNFVPLYIGRFFHGYGAGGFSYVIPIMRKWALIQVNEVSPPRIRGATSVLFQVTVTLGIVVAALIGLGLPKKEGEVKQSDIMWRVLVGFPVVMAVIQVIGFLSCFRYDTPQKYLEKDDSLTAKKALLMIYTPEGAQRRLRQLEIEISGSTNSSTSFMEAIKANSQKALYVCVVLSIFQQLSGINGIIFYSSQIFGSQDVSDFYQGIIVSVLVGSVNCGSTLLALAFVEKLGRKLMLVIGFFIMTAFDVLTGVFVLLDNNTLEKVMILLFIVAFQFSAGPLFWAYMPQALNPAGVTIGGAVNWIFTIIISVVTPQLAKLGQWMFYIFGIFNFLAAFFVLIFLVESKGKTKIMIQNEYNKTYNTSQMYTDANSKVSDEENKDMAKLLQGHD